MFCINCGAQIEGEAKFCYKCGANQEIKVQEIRVQETNAVVSKKPIKGIISFYLQIFLSPIMFIFRMLTQEVVVNTDLRSLDPDDFFEMSYNSMLTYAETHTDLIVPDNIKVVMYILLACAVIFSLSCSGKKEIENKGKITTAKILSFVNILISIAIIQIIA